MWKDGEKGQLGEGERGGNHLRLPSDVSITTRILMHLVAMAILNMTQMTSLLRLIMVN